MVGLFINLLVHRFELQDSLPALAVLEDSSMTLAKNLQHQSLAQAKQIEKLWDGDSLSEVPLFNTMINFRKFSDDRASEETNQEEAISFHTLYVSDPWDVSVIQCSHAWP